MADKYSTLGREIYANIGGPNNVESMYHCMTRLRIKIRDNSKVDIAGLKNIDGVLGVVDADTLEIVLGSGVNAKVAQDMVSQVGVKEDEEFPTNVTNDYQSEKSEVQAKAAEVHAQHKAQLKQTWWRKALDHISAIFIPLIPAFIGAGLISGVAGILKNMLTVKMFPASWALGVTILSMISSALFSYLNIYVGINTAKEFGATPGLGGIIGGVVLLPGIVAPVTIPNFLDGKPLAAGQGGIIGVLFAVWILSYVEKWFHKHIADSVDIIFTPFLTVLIMGLFTVFVVMPIAGWISNSLVGAINWVLNVGGPVAGFLLGLFFLPMVMLGLHQILTPIHLEMIQKIGYTPLLPILAMAGAGQVGAAIALWVKCRKNKELVRLIKGALPVGILGVGEPLIYGVTLPLGRPFITACIGGGIGGAVVASFGHVGAIAIGPSGVALIPLIANNMWWGYVIGLLCAYAGGFVATYFWGVPKTAMEGEVKKPTQAVKERRNAETKADNLNMHSEKVEVAFEAPVTGKLQKLEDVKDDVFSKKMLGDGFAIDPSNGKIVAPVDGTIDSVMDTKHAITLKTNKGHLDVLMHLGLDTVELKGKPFIINVKPGDKVKAGTQIGSMDIKAIKEAGKEPVVLTIIANMDYVDHVVRMSDGEVEAGKDVFHVITK
ncbi:glucose PTS transporter subunit IIA [Lactobacillus helveticus]|jgi:sucrose PTS system EIIBCA or EIIBC component|uniref:PTS system EIIBC component n=2 Tax=Lactobacillus helveticus TaxID=1587 RepID=A0A9Q5BXN4_LACHE|nr:glucose PTS transporter subunit IIA [Lactobacillus helveticus]ADX71174.1 Phosphoenolpyruvate-dependent sugar phosphotransferase system EIIABC, probable beta-glucoside specific [Lactobacillus helveticus H10]MCT3402353.1 PTS beta-glucoside transporter subunit EIIBCA [Lactobacillus helveticus]NRN75162.1 PTS system EIIBC component [Lactobacillus helveticus]NRN79717.1 PTS system EIIBC component [Lactobacillus helveticus]NRN81424.1 PTS system EIIBC component [Lactobacillus helveticus]